jgi:hypothetical protein
MVRDRPPDASLLCKDRARKTVESYWVLDIIRLYGLRFKIECSFKQAVRQISSFSYHLWTANNQATPLAPLFSTLATSQQRQPRLAGCAVDLRKEPAFTKQKLAAIKAPTATKCPVVCNSELEMQGVW